MNTKDSNMQLTAIQPKINYYLKRIDNEKTRTAYENSLRQFVEYLVKVWDVRSLNGITLEVFDAYIKTLAKKHKPTTVNAKKSAIKKFFSYLYDRDIISNKDFSLMKGVKQGAESRLQPCPKISAVFNLLNTMPAQTANEIQSYLVIFILANTGIRREELANLKKEDFVSHVEGKWKLHVTGKGGKLRKIPVNNLVVQKVLELTKALKKLGVNSPYIITGASHNSNREKPVTLCVINQRVSKVAKDFKVEDLTPHGIRRHYVSYLYARGMDLHKIKDRMGHSNALTTEEYVSDESREIRDSEEGETPAAGV